MKIRHYHHSGPRWGWWFRLRGRVARWILPKVISADSLEEASPGEKAKWDQIMFRDIRAMAYRSREMLFLFRTHADFVEALSYRTFATQEEVEQAKATGEITDIPTRDPFQARLAEDWLREHREGARRA